MENNQKNAAEVQTSVPDLIPANYREKAEALGWVIDEDKVCGVFTFRQGSPAGEDYSFDSRYASRNSRWLRDLRLHPAKAGRAVWRPADRNVPLVA